MSDYDLKSALRASLDIPAPERASEPPATLAKRVRLKDIATLAADRQRHPLGTQCALCRVDCSVVALVSLVYTHEVCRCEAAEYPHLVETIYHRACFLKANAGE